MSWIAEQLGPKLQVAGEQKDAGEVIGKAKFVALYFSAHWCAPCRKFTPFLSGIYLDQGDAKEVEVVFVSADEDIDSFDEYFAEMPWAAVPFDSDMREAISTKFDIAGIPRLIVLDAATGAVVNEDARAAVTSSKKLAGVF